MNRLLRHLVLPKEISEFEARYLARLNRVGLVFFALHVPVMMALAFFNETKPWLAFVLGTAVVVGPALANTTLHNPRVVSMTYGVAAMFMGGLLVHFGQGPVQIEMHFYFFALIAMLAVYGNPLVILAAAVTVALHHLALWFLLPRSVFNYEAPVWVVAVHALFVVLESVAACYIARSFFDNVIGLEKIVQARTDELAARQRDMRRVLDNVRQGFVTIDRNGLMSAERSLQFDRWFGATPEPETLWSVFARHAPDFAECTRVSWTEVVEGIMPLELTLEQMPRALQVGDAHYRVAYHPVVEGADRDRFLVVVTDVTAEIVGERAERDRRETMLLFERLLSDRNAVLDYFEEGSALVAMLAQSNTSQLVALSRSLHTLKGNSAIFGLESVAALCHDLESYVADEKRAPGPAQLEALRARWEGLTANVDRLLGARRHVIEILERDHAALEQSVRGGAPSTVLLPMVHALKLEPTQRRMEHFGEQVHRIAARLGKEVDVVVKGNELRVDPTRWAGFWSAFIHAVRNSMDHGLEFAAERVEQGKPSTGRVSLQTYLRADRFVVEIADDGRGIDWARIGRRAQELGLPAKTEEELRDALFRDGVSTATQITDISGRGVGMGTVQAATRSLGGVLELDTKAGRGTALRMVFPKASMTQEARPVAPTAAA